ncbi:MAG: hypothetical protein CVU80_00995 [Elusimicrobia bacterium HGW-Elusimicrobia-4]|nr:MAG: hypothetical protein CVU80_00995 [Elusimicrobia bacterium HGW-Elusimicrobia-4]
MKKNDFGKLVSELSSVNILLWHEEDNARSQNIKKVFLAKRSIDKLNQRRCDLIEKIDEAVLEALKNGRNSR